MCNVFDILRRKWTELGWISKALHVCLHFYNYVIQHVYQIDLAVIRGTSHNIKAYYERSEKALHRASWWCSFGIIIIIIGRLHFDDVTSARNVS